MKLKPGILDSEDSREREGIACAKGLRQERRPEAVPERQQADGAGRGGRCGVRHGPQSVWPSV